MSEYTLADHFQVRLDESSGLKALFEKVFFDLPYSADAMQALQRSEYLPVTGLPGKPVSGKPASGTSDQATPAEPVTAEVADHRPPELEARDPAAPFSDAPRSILLYRGESGVGKTRIFRQFREYAEERKIPVYEIHCYDVEGIPFKPFLRVIREILRDFEFEEILRGKYRPGLERLLPEIFRKEETVPPVDFEKTALWEKLDYWQKLGSWEGDKTRIFDGITQLLFEITAVHPVVILVHDLGWGDQGTIELLRYIGRNIQLRNAQLQARPEAGQGAAVGWLPDEAGIDDPERLDLSPAATRRPPSGKIASERLETRPIRLMILGNYEGMKARDPEESDAGADYLERSLCSLGKEPFAYHGEIRTLNREESRRFLQRSLSESFAASEDRPTITIDDDAVARIHHFSQGFPGFMHEIVRLVLREHVNGGGAVPDCIRAHMVDDSMAADAVTADAVTADPMAAESAPHDADLSPPDDADSASSDATPAEPDSPLPQFDGDDIRYRILERRLQQVDGGELEVLRALALARKPLSLPFLRATLCGGPAPQEAAQEGAPEAGPDELETVLSRLESRFVLEKVGQLYPHGGQEDGYYFRIWDYSEVISRAISGPRPRRDLHERIGSALAEQLGTSGDEKAFEVFYHLLRGATPRSSLRFGLIAARRFARSFSIEKAILVLEDLLRIFDRQEDLEIRLNILEEKAAYLLNLGEFEKAEATVQQFLDEGAQTLDDSRQAELLIRQGEIYRLSGDTHRALKVLSKAYRKIRDDKSMLAVSWHLTSARVRKDRVDAKRAVNLCLKAIKICQKRLESAATEGPPPELRELAELHRLVAQAFSMRGDDAHAVDHLQRSLEGFEAVRDEASSAAVLDDLGDGYLEQGNYFRAARYFYKALEFKRRNQDIAGLCKSYDELGMVYLRTGDEIKTIGLLNHSIHLKEKIGDLEGLNPTLGILGELYFRLGRYQKAIEYFQREIQNSEALKDTGGLVDAFTHLGWVYFEIGDFKQVSELTRQVGILATEFKLKAQEGGGARLRGVYEAQLRNWNEAESQLKLALEISSRQGNRRLESEILLDQAELRYARESYSEGLKLVSKGLVFAEQLQAVDLQVRGHVIKGNIQRFLNGGSFEKSNELLRRGLELARTVNDVHLAFDLNYSLAKVYHYAHEFVQAGSLYGRAEAILRRIAEDLPDDQAVRYFEDPRRKLFLEDANRYRKEVKGRLETDTVGDPRARLTAFADQGNVEPIGPSDYKELSSRVLRVNSAQHAPDFFDVLLREAVDLVKPERAFILRVQNRQFYRVAQCGFGDSPEDNPEFPSAQAITEEAVRKGKPGLVSGAEESVKDGKYPQAGALLQRTLLVIPLATPERIFGAIYLDRPLPLGKFTSRDQVLLESLASHAGCALENRRHFETAVLEPLTGLNTTSYFLGRLTEAYRLYNLHGKPFLLLGFYMPTLESSMKDGPRVLGERLAVELQEEVPPTAVVSWGSPILSILVPDLDLRSTDRLAHRIQGRLIGLLNCRVTYKIVSPEARLPSADSMYIELRRNLLPEESDQQTILEIRQLLSRDITLKDAKQILEKHIIENTLKKTGGNITHAARELGIHRPQLSNLLKKHSLKRERFERTLRN